MHFARHIHDTLLLDYPHLDFGVDVGVKTDGHAINPERTDWLVELDLPLFHSESLRFELVRDVRRGDRSKELSLIADASGKSQGNLFELRCELRGRTAPLLF